MDVWWWLVMRRAVVGLVAELYSRNFGKVQTEAQRASAAVWHGPSINFSAFATMAQHSGAHADMTDRLHSKSSK